MARFSLVGDPQLDGSRLTWSAVLDPGTMEVAPAGSSIDTVDCFRMTSDDPSGNDAHGELVMQAQMQLRNDVMPGDTYTESVDLDLRDGYYHVMLMVDADESVEAYKLHVRVSEGVYDLKTGYRTS